MTLRPQDRIGVVPGTALSHVNQKLYLTIASSIRDFPNFWGKIRASEFLYNVLGLENHHIIRQASMDFPIKYVAILDLHSRHERWAYLMRQYEKDTTEFLFKIYDTEGCFLNIGANVGLIAIPFAKLCAEANAVSPKVFCLDAVASNVERLRKNVELNLLSEVVIAIEAAVGETVKVAEIQVEGNLRAGEGTGTANILADDTTHQCERIAVNITTIDSLVQSGVIPSNISLIKIDVDGYDLKVLQGSTQLLRTSRPIIFGGFMAHCLKWHGQSIFDIKRFFSDFDYVVLRKVGREFLFMDSGFDSYVSDLLIVPREKLE